MYSPNVHGYFIHRRTGLMFSGGGGGGGGGWGGGGGGGGGAVESLPEFLWKIVMK
jgi:hypothetical protein